MVGVSLCVSLVWNAAGCFINQAFSAMEVAFGRSHHAQLALLASIWWSLTGVCPPHNHEPPMVKHGKGDGWRLCRSMRSRAPIAAIASSRCSMAQTRSEEGVSSRWRVFPSYRLISDACRAGQK